MSKLPRLLPLIAVAIGGVVAVRAVGVAPDLFQGARAWAEEAVPVEATAAPARPPAPAVCALSPDQLAEQAGISPAELRIIQSLSARRTELDARDADFATTLPLMVAAEQKLDAKLQALEAIKAEVQALLGQADEREQAEINRLVAVYSAMRPREAAAVFVNLNDDVRLPVAAAMRPRALAAVMAQMPPAAAKILTEKLAARFEAQTLAARAAAAGSTETAAATTPVPAPTPNPAPTPAASSAAAAPTATDAPARPAARQPARRTPARAAAATTPPADGPVPYQAPDAPPPAPRQTVQ